MKKYEEESRGGVERMREERRGREEVEEEVEVEKEKEKREE